MGEAAGVSLTVKVNDRVTPRLAELGRRLRHFDPALDEIGSSLVTSTQMRFEPQEGPDGTKWKGLAESTKARRGRTRRGGTASILRDQADLYDSLTHKVAPSVGVTVGVTRVYGRIHQLGGQAGRGHKVTIEARPYLGLSDADRAEIDQILRSHLGGGL